MSLQKSQAKKIKEKPDPMKKLSETESINSKALGCKVNKTIDSGIYYRAGNYLVVFLLCQLF